ncbi:Mediator of RNA polymerase II transcription subunit 7 [Didymosphaeria variabile]|uniref:Mediator of RNA polymerase II transcription subunit 7 n=1 Tax=Didymosphaeria variabile TaxID=1932322 RepID=A0A9W9C9W6_9PLEO|nr:Mediator of RNA polymerase II transcription subunit 7 [Didymosphaeria variabile]KAJ4350467.1 Mediator of RNA polymerase II transcription subunit 7 [Didymosphaeria variabile]
MAPLPNGPPSTIRQLANQIGVVHFAGPDATIVHPIIPYNPVNVTAGYQEGVGLNRTFLEYLWDGATAASIGEECVSLYKFIVQHYTDEHDIFLFGYSRGAFTVRCVGGMINNCGILRGEATQSAEELDTLCQEVYRTYRSPLAVDHPQSERCRSMKSDISSVWQVNQPIRFMGLIDTVGALGIPRLNAGIGFNYKEFELYDQKVSSAVQVVYHALSLHERTWELQPCFIYPPPGNATIVKQQWFPGVHHDLGRSTFRYLRQRPWNTLEGFLDLLPSFLTKTEWPNEVCSDVVACWILQGIKDVEAPIDPNFTVPGIDREIRSLSLRISAPDPRTLGTGDTSSAASSSPAATPASAPTSTQSFLDTLKRLASLPFTLLNSLFPRFGNASDSLGLSAILGTLAATIDRRIPRATLQEEVYPYLNEETVVDDVGRERRFTVGRFEARDEGV